MARTNIKYLKENNLYDAHKHFMRLSEAYMPVMFPEEEVDEAADDQDQSQQGMGPGQGDAMDDPMGGGGMPQGQDPDQMGPGQEDPMGGDGMQQGPDGGMEDPMGGEPGGDDPMAEAPDMGPDPLEDEMAEEEAEDTIDIDGLTKAQDKLNVKQNRIGRDVSKVDTRISSLIGAIESLLAKVDDNNSEIESLKAEFEKRNPTQTEKLNLRSLDSYPFNIKPSEYWAEKAKEGGYEAYADNSEPTTQEYEITNDDVDNPSQDIIKTFFTVDDDDVQTLDKLFKL